MVGAGKTTAEQRARQLEDSDIKPVLEAKEEGKKPVKERTNTMSRYSRHYLLLWDQLKVADGVLVKEFVKRDGLGTYGLVIVPEKVKGEILQSMHGGLLAGHMGTKKTKAKILQRWGCPVSILSDQGRTYESKVFQELCRLLGVKKVRTSVRNPRCNGQVERFNRTLVRMIRAYLQGVQEDWDLNLGCLAGAYRATPNEVTKLTPNLLTMGREERLPAELVFGSTTNKSEVPVTSYGDYVDGIRSKMNHAHDIAMKHLQKSAARSHDIYDKRMLVNNYEKGDLVFS
ncbi:uncharacterized protein K02A2.6-like [Mercenaria mercenaria]|uniref:uncharacterized protein K02A2.6-like n=1 Tax=Mercenaria mercenaria TaxID=6596 RepID=UPI00234F8961|nr:uncharacterized protein K02A2.6-like [Mercenaria mercenaria]